MKVKHHGRGLPDNVSEPIVYECGTYVMSPEEYKIFSERKGRHYLTTKVVSPEKAKEMLDSGEVFPINHRESVYNRQRDISLEIPFVSYPGLVAPNWLYLDEIYENLEYSGISIQELKDNECQLFPTLLDLMNLMEKRYGERRVRMVMIFVIT
ncbi:MAG: hypothetical protein R3C11_17665 [Planctomycetaceae bacterium]